MKRIFTSQYIKLIFLVFLNLLNFNNSKALKPVDLVFNNISIKEGLSNSNVKCIIQDYNGFMWFGTENGLNKFDGLEITTYKHNPTDSSSLIGNQIFSLFEDHNKILWIGTTLGLCTYNNVSDNYKQNPLPEMQFQAITYICQDKHGEYWFCTNGSGIFHYSEKLKFIENLIYKPSNKNSINSNSITFLYEDHRGLIWIATNDSGICTYNRDNKKFQQYKYGTSGNSLSDNYVNSIFEDSYSEMWICTINGLDKFDPGFESF